MGAGQDYRWPRKAYTKKKASNTASAMYFCVTVAGSDDRSNQQKGRPFRKCLHGWLDISSASNITLIRATQKCWTQRSTFNGPTCSSPPHSLTRSLGKDAYLAKPYATSTPPVSYSCNTGPASFPPPKQWPVDKHLRRNTRKLLLNLAAQRARATYWNVYIHIPPLFLMIPFAHHKHKASPTRSTASINYEPSHLFT